LTVWSDAIEYYALTQEVFRKFPYDNIALGSLGESVSGLHAYRKSEQLPFEEFEALDSLAYKLENGLLKLVESLEQKREQGDWIDHLIVKESNAVYGNG